MIFDLIYFLNIVLSIITALYLWFKIKPKHFKLHTRLLATYLLLNALCFSFYLLIKYEYINYIPFLYKITAPITYLILPAAYFHVKIIIKNRIQFKKKDFIHLIPFVIFTISYLPFYFQNFELKSNYVATITKDMSLINKDNIGIIPEFFNSIGRLIQPIIYITLQWVLLKKKNITNFIKDNKTIYAWLLMFVKIQTFLFSSLIITILTSEIFLPSFNQNILNNISLVLTVASFFALSIYLFWSQKTLQKLKYFNPKHTILEGKHFSMDIDTISKIVFEEKYFLDSKNHLSDISKKLKLSNNEFSKIINTRYPGFNSWINQLKIKHSTTLIKDGYLNNYSIEALAIECGFNSKNTFYRAFKKTTQKTPTEYAKEHLEK